MAKKTTKKTAARKSTGIRVVCPALFGAVTKSEIGTLLGWVGAQERPATDLSEALAQDKGTPVLVLCDAPDIALARLLQRGDDPAGALAAWAEWADTTLRAQRRASRRITLADRALARAGAEALQPLAERLGLEAVSLKGTDKAAPAALEILCAAQLIASDPAAAELARAWREAAHMAPGDAPLPLIADALAGQRSNLVELTRLREALKLHLEASEGITAKTQVRQDQTSTIELLREALRLHLEAAEAHTAEKEALKAHIARLTPAAEAADQVAPLREALFLHLENADRMAGALRAMETRLRLAQEQEADRLTLKARTEALERALAERDEDRRRAEAILGAQLLQDSAYRRDLQARLARVWDEVSARDKALAQAETTLAATKAAAQVAETALRDQLADLRKTHTAEVIQIKEAVATAQSALVLAQREAETTRSGLDQFRKAASVARAEADAALGAAAALQARLGSRQTLLEELTRTRQTLQADLSHAQDKITVMEAELTRIYGSNSWRLTEPMRALRRATQRPKGE